jgi:hypothetical protein
MCKVKYTFASMKAHLALILHSVQLINDNMIAERTIPIKQLRTLRGCVTSLPSQAKRVESCCGQRRTAECIVPAVKFGIKLSVEHLGPVSLTVGHIQPLSLPELSKSPVCPLAALEQCYRVPCFPSSCCRVPFSPGSFCGIFAAVVHLQCYRVSSHD